MRISTGTIALLTAIAVLAACATRIASPPGTRTTVILVRHAERTAITKQLTDAGRARARDLRDALADENVSAIYSPDLPRNIDTARPLAEHLRQDITVVRGEVEARALVDIFLTRHAGGTVLWVGNMDNLKSIFTRLGGRGEPPGHYDDLYRVTVDDKGATRTERARYGAPVH